MQYPESESNPTLTGRETQVLRRLVGGQTNKQIANELGITPKAVEFHVSKLLKKHAVSSRFELTDLLRLLSEDSEDESCAEVTGLVTPLPDAAPNLVLPVDVPHSRMPSWERSRLRTVARVVFNPDTGFPYLVANPDLATPATLIVGAGGFLGLALLLELPALSATPISTILMVAPALILASMGWFLIVWPTKAVSLSGSLSYNMPELSVLAYALLPATAWIFCRGVGVLIGGDTMTEPGALVYTPDPWPFWTQAFLSTLNVFILWTTVLVIFAVRTLSRLSERRSILACIPLCLIPFGVQWALIMFV